MARVLKGHAERVCGMAVHKTAGAGEVRGYTVHRVGSMFLYPVIASDSPRLLRSAVLFLSATYMGGGVLTAAGFSDVHVSPIPSRSLTHTYSFLYQCMSSFLHSNGARQLALPPPLPLTHHRHHLHHHPSTTLPPPHTTVHRSTSCPGPRTVLCCCGTWGPLQPAQRGATPGPPPPPHPSRDPAPACQDTWAA